MIRAGDSIENPVTGERLVFRKTSRETGGQAVVIETFVQPNGFVAAAHLHPSQEERFEVFRGSVGFKIGRKKASQAPASGSPFRPARRTSSGMRATKRRTSCTKSGPALQFESLLETMFALATDGKTNRKGMPNPLRLAVIANAHFDTVQLPFPPALLQRIALGMGAPVGKLVRLHAHLRPGCAAGAGDRLMRRRLFFGALVVALLVLALLGFVLRIGKG